jgi:beta-glucanase (GH16 family)
LPNRITWYVDGVKQFETFDKNVIPKVPMHMTIQLDMGPYREWIPAADATTPPEVSLWVDWVKIFAAPREARG